MADSTDRVNLRHHAKLRGGMSNRYRDIAIYRFQDGGRPPPCIFNICKAPLNTKCIF